MIARATCGAMSAVVLAACVLHSPAGAAREGNQAPVIWQIDNLSQIGGHPVRPVGAPEVVTEDGRRAVRFNGRSDGLFLDANPLEGLARFTVEVVFLPDADGPAEQRFLHFEEASGGARALVETRILDGGRWCLDTFLRDSTASLALIDRAKTHAAGTWHTAALTYDGATMAHYVDGVKELEGQVKIRPQGPGRTSIGVRQNLVHWFKGRIRLVRITPDVVPAVGLLRAEPLSASDRR